MKNLYENCTLCPRRCGVNRLTDSKGFCGETSALRIAAAVIHKGEEPPITGNGGSGTIFISGCNLGCSFCQNHQVSHNESGGQSIGKEVTPDEFARICAALRDNGAENINIVTGSHAVPSIIEGIAAARKNNVSLPMLWNSSGYDSITTLDLLSGYIDIYLPDLKTLDSKTAEIYFNAPDYPETAKAAILKMIGISRQKHKGDKSRVIIRHLILPGHLESTKEALHWFADNAKENALLSLMTQYTPVENRKTTGCASQQKQPLPKGYLSAGEFDKVLYWLNEFEIEDGFCQELVKGSDWLPDFRRVNPFPSQLSIPVWSCIS